MSPGASWGVYHWHEYRIHEFLPASRGGERILLLGCGDAGERPYLEELGFRPVGLDIRRAPAVDVIGDAHHLPFPDGHFDVVLSMQVLEHLHSPWVAVREVARVLRPRGAFVGSVAFLKPYHASYFHMTHDGVRQLLATAGLETDRLEGAQSPTYSVQGSLVPVGGRGLRRAVLGSLDSLVFGLRVLAWRLSRREDPDALTHRFDSDFPFSFRTFDRLRFSPAVVFRGRKPA